MKKIIPLLMASFLLAMSISTQAQLLAIKIINTVNPTCSYDSNGSANVVVSGGVAPYTYLWEPSGQTTDSAVGLKAAVPYTLTVTDYASDSIIEYFTLTSSSTLLASTSSAEVSCFGMSNGMASVLPTGGMLPYQYLWQPVAQTTATATALTAGTYTAQVMDANGCTVQTPATVAQPTPLNVTALTYASAATAIANGGVSPYTFSWSPSGQTTQTALGLAPGTYTVTVNDAHLCFNSVVVTVDTTIITFSFDYPETSCGDPSYVDFAVWAASSPPSVFNSCVLQIQYSKSEFAGDNFANGGIIVTQGRDFQPGPGNDYAILDTLSLPGDTIMQIRFGDPSDSSVNGTVLNPLSKNLLYVRLRIQNSCSTGAISYPTGFYNDSNYYSLTYKTFNHIDSASVIIGDSLCCPYTCSYDCYPYSCDGWCCVRDTVTGDCIDSCYDICYHTCTGTCYDTFPIYAWTYDTVYNYYSQNFKYFTTGFTGTRTTTACDMKMYYWTPVINAGTNAKSVPPNSSLLTVTGQGFGNQKGSVIVSDANVGFGTFYLDTMDMVSWTDSRILIRMPSYVLADTNPSVNETPGSGYFNVISACSHLDSHIYPKVQINYNIENEYHIPTQEKTRPDIIMSNDTESFFWRCDTSVSNNPQAYACVKKAIQEWNCYTGVNWKLGPPDTINAVRYYGVSNISFSSIDFSPPSALMVTTQEFLNPCYNYTDSVSYYNATDIVIKQNQYLGGPLWSYDTTGLILPGVYYFYDAILHELGHAHGLGHINDSLSLMFWKQIDTVRVNITSGRAYPGPATLLGGLDMVNTSAVNSPASCPPDSILTPSFRYCVDPTLNIPAILENSYNFNLYPNPTNGRLIISYKLSTTAMVEFSITDIVGRVLATYPVQLNSNGSHTEEVNVGSFASGLYFFNLHINDKNITIKFIKL